jgi:hypothetical protein
MAVFNITCLVPFIRSSFEQPYEKDLKSYKDNRISKTDVESAIKRIDEVMTYKSHANFDTKQRSMLLRLHAKLELRKLTLKNAFTTAPQTPSVIAVFSPRALISNKRPAEYVSSAFMSRRHT